jgi:hypothetical protein
MGVIRDLLTRAAHYRWLAAQTSDERAPDAAISLAEELEQQASKMKKHAEQKPSIDRSASGDHPTS